MVECQVCIVGGGLAGLTLARQLKLRMPDLAIEVLEKGPSELPVSTHKVGESTVEGASHYLAVDLGLRDYLEQTHLPKLGLRAFGGSRKSFSDRFEIGAIDFPPVPSFQIDRGVLETDLQRMCRDQGISIRNGCLVERVELSDSGTLHRVSFVQDNRKTTMKTRWLIDATGRRRLLASKMGLTRKSAHAGSACWWRVAGEYDVSRVRCDDPTFHLRTRNRRWFSTNHLLGKGYWVWIIPLCSGNTSIGIVSDENVHPISTHNTYDKALVWLAENEPEFAAFLGKPKALDFHALKNFAYSTVGPFSASRWACVGEAATFIDPLYSTASDLIAWANTFVVQMVQADREGGLDDGRVRFYNEVFEQTTAGLTDWFRDSFVVFGNDRVALAKLLWDSMHYFSFPARTLLHGALEDLDGLRRYWPLYQRMIRLNEAVQQLFRDWAKLAPPKTVPPGLYHPFIRCPAVRGGVLGSKELTTQTYPDFLAEQERRFSLLQEVAIALFRLGVRDALPEQIERVGNASGIRPERVGLRPEAWERDQTFDAPFVRAVYPDLPRQLEDFLSRPIDPTTEMPRTTEEIRVDEDRAATSFDALAEDSA